MKIKKLKESLESLSLSETLLFILLASVFAGLLTHVGFVLAHKETDLLIVLTVFIITYTRILQNYFYKRINKDRDNKVMSKSDKTFSRLVLAVLWVTTTLLSGRIFLTYPSHYQGILLLVCISIGIFFPYARKYCGLQMFLTALTNCLLVLFTYNIYDCRTIYCAVFSIFIFFIILGREILQDAQNVFRDNGYRKTVITDFGLSDNEVLQLIIVPIFIGLNFCMCMLMFPSLIATVSLTAFKTGYLVCFLVLVSLFFIKNKKQAQKNLLDVGIALIIIAFAIIPLFTK